MSAAVVCFVDSSPHGNYLVDRLREDVGVDLAVVVEPDDISRRLTQTVRTRGVAAISDIVADRVGALVRRHATAHVDFDHWFGDDWHELDEDLPRLVTRSGSDPAVLDAVRRLRDVHLVVHANVLVSMELIAACRAALNLHWGLSPYYRGTYCTEWALLHRDVENIGVTVHELTQRIDGGAIVGQRRATVSPVDTVESLNAQLTVLGVEILRESLRILDAGGSLATTPQDLSLGHLMLKRQWTRHLRRQVSRLERRGLQALIASPSRPALPIVAGPTRADAA